MKYLHLLLGSALFSIVFVSCETPDAGSSGGRVIMYPTVDQMARYEQEWGMEPRQVRSRNVYDDEPANYAPTETVRPPASNSAPPPQPTMLAPAPDPVLDPPQPAVDPATIQKLR